MWTEVYGGRKVWNDDRVGVITKIATSKEYKLLNNVKLRAVEGCSPECVVSARSALRVGWVGSYARQGSSSAVAEQTSRVFYQRRQRTQRKDLVPDSEHEQDEKFGAKLVHVAGVTVEAVEM